MKAKYRLYERANGVFYIEDTESKAFDFIRNRVLLVTKADDLRRVLDTGTVATNVFLRRIHNFALGMGWITCPILAKKQWPEVRFAEKRAITWDGHLKILDRELSRNCHRLGFCLRNFRPSRRNGGPIIPQAVPDARNYRRRYKATAMHGPNAPRPPDTPIVSPRMPSDTIRKLRIAPTPNMHK